MAKVKTSKLAAIKSKKGKKETLHISLSKKNYFIIGAGLFLIVLGYIFMSENSVDGFMPTVVAPVLLFFGYCIFIPIGILYRDKSGVDFGVDEKKDLKRDTEKAEGEVIASNIKTG